MAKLLQVVLVVVAAVACTADPIKFRGNPRNNRFFARQEAAPAPPSSSPAPAPYPPAGVTPSVAFELPTEQTTPQPDNTYLPPAPAPTPDNTYGPPEQTYGPPQPDNQYGPPQPDNQYGPPAQDPSPAGEPAEDPQAERIVFFPRNRNAPAKLRQQLRRAQPLRAAKLQLEPFEIVRSQPVIAYSVQYKSF